MSSGGAEARWDTGWTLLPDIGGVRAHQPDPDNLGQAMCGRDLDPAETVHKDCPVNVPACIRCGLAADDARTAARAAVAGVPVQRSGGRKWLILPYEQGPRLVHRWNRDSPKQTMCGRPSDTAVPVERRAVIGVKRCRACEEAVDRMRTKAGRRMVKVNNPTEVDRLDRQRSRGTSIRTVRGGLPTLGRNR
jgi:hypothetical protein